MIRVVRASTVLWIMTMVLGAAACLQLPHTSRDDPTTDYRYKGIIAAAAQGNMRWVQAILSRDPKAVDDVTPRRGLTALHVACMSCYPRHIEIARLLLRFGSPIDRPCDDGSTPLHYAARYCCVDMVTFLVANNASVLAVNHDERTPIQETVRRLVAQHRLTSTETGLKRRCRAVIRLLIDHYRGRGTR
ncbi:MAG: ankyrin repeat domain-containing protein [Proteobacteria bacterium]|nr:ankyrin repeat domain-containing protein [Pseudomonadota bacterium]MBU1741104.1 ankyrin repeat domain-containing protein [Pseudomonadota bacterium]